MLVFALLSVVSLPLAQEGDAAPRPLEQLVTQGVTPMYVTDSVLCAAPPHPDEPPALSLHRVRCVTDAAGAAAFAQRQRDNALLVYPPLLRPLVERLDKTSAAAGCALLAAAAARAQPFDGDTAARESWAEMFAQHRSSCDKGPRAAFDMYLYRDLGETAAARTFLDKAAPRAMRQHKDRALAIARAHTLTTRHDNQAVFKTLERVAARPLGDDACEVRYLLGKAARKTRRYSRARQELDHVITKCPDPWKKKARFLLARVATYQGAKDAVAILDAFIAAYPQDSLTDDVLLWKAEHFAHRGRYQDADAAYGVLLTNFPDGDMAPVARFDRAFLRARSGDAPGARTALDQALRDGADDDPLTHDQALYWRARLAVFPQLSSYALTKDAGLLDEGIAQLLSLAEARPASFYGDLAKKVLRIALQKDGRDRADLDARLRKAVAARRRPARRVWFDRAPLEDDPQFVRGVTLLRDGYTTAGRLVLDAIERQGLDANSRSALALAYRALGDLPRTHQVMRFSGSALLAGTPRGDAARVWDLAYPRAHAAPIAAAADEVGVPPTLLMGLAREESAFEAAVTSWAGAIGLCQLMPFTAKEEAGLLKVGDPTREELFSPALNARLGGNHLSRRIKGLGHPFLGIAAYNAGPGNVKKWRKADAPKTVDAWVELIPVAQTRGYVKKVAGSWIVYSWLDEQKEIEYDMMLP